MSRVQVACALIAFLSVIGLMYDSSHGNLDIFWISSFVPWLGITLAATGASLRRGTLRSLKTALISDAATSEDKERSALALETAGRLAHAASAFMSLVAVIVIFQNLGSDIGAIGRSTAESVLTMLYAIAFTEFILAPPAYERRTGKTLASDGAAHIEPLLVSGARVSRLRGVCLSYLQLVFELTQIALRMLLC